MTEYRNPYHFVPVKRGSRVDDLPRKQLTGESKHVTHDRYYPGAYSGRIICRLTTETPIFVGAKRIEIATEHKPAKVTPFELDNKPAVPGSTLRGLVSSIAEAASNSALRVLDDAPFSYRKTMERGKGVQPKDKPLSAIGMILVRTDTQGKEQFLLRPLTLPTVEGGPGKPLRLPPEFRGLYPVPNLKVYVGDKDSIQKLDYGYQTFSLWKYDQGSDAPSAAGQEDQFYGLKLHRRSWHGRDELLVDDHMHSKEIRTRDRGLIFLLAQRTKAKAEPKRWKDIPEDQRGEYTRGILRVLGCTGREDIPDTKRHEIFIPYPEDVRWKEVPIPPSVIERFYDLADQRTEASDEDAEWPWPYEPKGTLRNLEAKETKDRRLGLKEGDLLYFRPTDDGKAVAEISLSSIWRGRVEYESNGEVRRTTARTFFEHVDPELVPFDSIRTVITLAEQLFGFVAEDRANDEEAALALAGRVYFSNGLLQGIKQEASEEWEPHERGLNEPYLPAVTLRVLDSPKPPCPPLYFKLQRGENQHIAKRRLNLNEHHPQGRKFYLHHGEQDGPEPWRSKPQRHPKDNRFKQKVEVTPIKPRAVFYFHVDFDNLSPRELGLLVYALKPTTEFRHKIGMGKPIGLGAVNIEPVGLCRVNRELRYRTSGLFAQRYCERWIAAPTEPDSWPDTYLTEKNAEGPTLDLSEIRESFTGTMDRDIKKALELIGAPDAPAARVHTPLVIGGEADDELETFRWFVANDLGSGRKETRIDPARRCLKPLNENTTRLPTLPALKWND
ncbi:MAG: TIGR03986 family CRISPR-associated RAMP protein [Acidobacteriota bacterium]